MVTKQTHAIAALLKERQTLETRIMDMQQRISAMTVDLSHIDATLRYMDGVTQLPKGRSRRILTAGLFYRQELPRTIMRVLASHPEGLRLSQLGRIICEAKGWDYEAEDLKFREAVAMRISKALDVKKNQGRVERKYKGTRARWFVKPPRAAYSQPIDD